MYFTDLHTIDEYLQNKEVLREWRKNIQGCLVPNRIARSSLLHGGRIIIMQKEKALHLNAHQGVDLLYLLTLSTSLNRVRSSESPGTV